MQETINLIEQKLGENKEVLRRLSTEQEKLVTKLADNHVHKGNLSVQTLHLEIQLKDLYDQFYNRKKDDLDCNTLAKGPVTLGSKNTDDEREDRDKLKSN